ncbi:MAG: protein-L-isoaspartate(D-aspartate) O-methyltransferase [Candidatus Omnitrophica bacterium]|nr:protein-L-isoaspartate(D-aspartate) O-methyltransferase [Candidatus Omnitrophota bacterium]
MKIFIASIWLALLALPLYSAEGNDFTMMRSKMVDSQIRARGITDPKVLDAMLKVERHQFVSDDLSEMAYNDFPLSIGHKQTISQPFIVAFMSAALKLKGDEQVLEIGTGSGYQAAILAEMVKAVYTIEIIEDLASEAAARLKELGYENIFIRHGDGYKGWKEFAPYDAIIVTAAPPQVPPELINQLKVGGKMIIPVGTSSQDLYFIEKNEAGVVSKKILPVRFVPMVKE